MQMIKRDAISEEKLVQRIRNGERELYEILIRRNNPYLYKIGRSYNYSHEDVEDLMQDTFISAFVNLSNLKDALLSGPGSPASC